MRFAVVIGLVLLWGGGGCGDGGSSDRDGGAGGDGAPNEDGGSRDGGSRDAADAALQGLAAHLLLTEVRADGPDEFIEIYNATGRAVDLSDVYLADHDQYHLLPSGDYQLEALFDFVVRFPEGAIIDDGEVIVVANDEVEYTAVYGSAPDYTIHGANASPAMTPIDVQDEGHVGGEVVVLFRWDGASDLVEDLDIVMVGSFVPDDDRLADKTAVAVDGPDPDDTPSTYAPDAATMPLAEDPSPFFTSAKRLVFEDDHELHDRGGNGITGDDETSEDTRQTWTSAADSFTAPTPGAVPPELLP